MVIEILILSRVVRDIVLVVICSNTTTADAPTQKVDSLEEIRKNLSAYGRPQPPPSSTPAISFPELYKRNVLPQAGSGSIFEDASKTTPPSLNAIRLGLRNQLTNPWQSQQPVGPKFARMYNYADLGEKLKKLGTRLKAAGEDCTTGGRHDSLLASSLIGGRWRYYDFSLLRNYRVTSGAKLSSAGGENDNARSGGAAFESSSSGGSSGNAGGMVVPGGGGDATSGEKFGSESETVGGGEATTTGGSEGRRRGGIGPRRNGLDTKGSVEEIGEKGHWSPQSPRSGSQFSDTPRRLRVVGRLLTVAMEETNSNCRHVMMMVGDFAIVDLDPVKVKQKTKSNYRGAELLLISHCLQRHAKFAWSTR
ncbi:hypothetical protein L2E82_27540 [Cichorium intybus]|uniref:Uncharacterized protein n=1 Tax=Cichorium intybus TaxID=13427 RepID=A0ACB9CTE1_CICIN|nr:hypothetical protein L2E82_27540 [Cichorium intybus]